MSGKLSKKQYDRIDWGHTGRLTALLFVVLGLGLFSAIQLRGNLMTAPSSAPRPERPEAPLDVRSPFTPWAGAGTNARAAEARVAGMRLAGVRSSADPARGGAVFTLTDGGQRAFAVGQEIAPGVRLAAVHADHVVLDIDGAEQRLDIPRAAQTPLGAASVFAESGSAVSAEATAATSSGAETSFWLAKVLARPEASVGEPYGWRVTTQVPSVPARAGLKRGDLILAVNGVGPAAGASGRALANQEFIQLTVVRASGERVTIRWSGAT